MVQGILREQQKIAPRLIWINIQTYGNHLHLRLGSYGLHTLPALIKLQPPKDGSNVVLGAGDVGNQTQVGINLDFMFYPMLIKYTYINHIHIYMHIIIKTVYDLKDLL